MTSPTHDHTTPDHTAHTITPTPPDARAPVADRVLTALDELDRAAFALGPLPTTDTGWASRSAAMALISARRAGWWRVLLLDEDRTHAVHPLLRHAAYTAHRRALDDARFWQETAADWQSRAEHRPTGDAAGALSNWDELGVTR